MYTFDYDANVAGDIVAVTVSVNGSVDHVENYTYDANHRMTQVLQSGANVAAKRVDIAYVDNRVGTMTRYADLSGTQLVATSTCEVTFRLHSCNVCTKGSRRTTGAVATTTAGNESSMLPPRCCCFPKSLEAMRLARLRRVRHRLNLPRSSHVRH